MDEAQLMASGPTPPDENDLTRAQTRSNIQTAVAQTGLNAMNVNSPYGSTRYTQNGTWPDGTPKFTQTTSLSQPLQNLVDTGIGTQQQVANQAGQLARGLNLSPINQPQYQQYGNGPNLNTQGGQIGNLVTNVNGGPIQNQIANSGQIQSSIGPSDYGAQRQSVEDALLGRVNQSYDRDRASLEQRLANQGVQVGSEAYKNSMDDFNRGLADARTSAVLGAGQEQNRLQQLALNAGNFANQAQAQQYGQNANNAGFANQAQAQAFGQGQSNADLNNAAQGQYYNQTLGNNTFANNAQQQQFQNQNTTTGLNNDLATQRFNNTVTGNNQQINQLLALLGGGQLNQSPQTPGTPQTGINGVDVSGNAWNQYTAQQNQSNQMWNGLGALGSTAASILPFILSDKRAKTDIRDTGMRTPGGVPIKDYRYKGSPMMQRGYLAQDVVRAGQGDAVARTPGGFLAVNYRRVA